MNNTAQLDFEKDRQRLRREVLTRRIIYNLRETIQLRGMKPDTPVNMVRADFTDASVAIVSQLAEAVDILEAIIWASDGCVGHRDCAHSMEPWQRARALLQDKWNADEPDSQRHWPEYKGAETPQGRYQMRPDQLSDELTYRNYKYNRLHAPDTTPQQWASIYGLERVQVMERRFQLDSER